MSLYKMIEEILNSTETENGDKAVKSTLSRNLDLFGVMGAMRFAPEEEKTKLLKFALSENPVLAVANMMYLRDVRGGMGERNSFRQMLRFLIEANPELAQNLLPHVPALGRWDDMLVFLDYPQTKDRAILLIKETLAVDSISDNPSLCAKWMPSENASSKTTKEYATVLRRGLGLTPKMYRKNLSAIRSKLNLIENYLRTGNYESVDYSHVPSQAMNKYRRAFERNDEVGFEAYLEALTKGETKVNVGALHPHEIIKDYGFGWGYTDMNWPLAQAQWDALERSTSDKKTIVVRDGSGSMTGLPMRVSTALAILMSEQLTGDFKDAFITFSSRPQLVKFPPNASLKDKLDITDGYDDMSNTNIEKVYQLIYDAIKENPEENRIDNILIISDMQFDTGVDGDTSTYQSFKRKFDALGVATPEVVFWNVDADGAVQFPATKHDNVKLISGFSNAVLQAVLHDETLSAESFMMETLLPYINLLSL